MAAHCGRRITLGAQEWFMRDVKGNTAEAGRPLPSSTLNWLRWKRSKHPSTRATSEAWDGRGWGWKTVVLASYEPKIVGSQRAVTFPRQQHHQIQSAG